ncbi:MAG: transketolase-like TK C-terminal-containing protein, partial [Desulfobacca sp.]|uniref:transketolase-like TK C-terminal-containing protein n=1 Tax=Desulfobacca sp. TaxID=2067990 RepID=UPI00404A07BC
SGRAGGFSPCRQNLPVLDPRRFPHIYQGVSRGGYVLAEAPSPSSLDLILAATGSEVALALKAQETLSQEGVAARVVSLPSWNLFQRQPEAYRQEVMPANVPVLVLETGVSLGWQSYFGAGPNLAVIGVDRFGASAPGEVVMQEYGFNTDNVHQKALALLRRSGR